MTRFLKNRGGYVELSQVARAQTGQTGRRPHGHDVSTEYAKFFDDDGRELVVGDVVDLEKLSSPVISAGPVTVVICITPTGEVTAAPIAGWRVLRTGLEPLFVVEPPAGAVRFLVVAAHGLVRLHDGVIFTGIDQARTAVMGAPVAPDPVAPDPVEPGPKAVVGGRRHAPAR
jgi:hypothetical protein